MAACIICNKQTLSGVSPNVVDMGSLRLRLEDVLGEAVPEDSVMCGSCLSDLEQIETYHALLTVFKKRYAETVKQRTLKNECQNDESRRNVLLEKSTGSSQDLQDIFGADNSPLPSNAIPHHDSKTTNNSKKLSPFVKLEVIDVKRATEELLTDSFSRPDIFCNSAVRLEIENQSEHTKVSHDQSADEREDENFSDTCDDNAWELDVDDSELPTPKLHEELEEQSLPNIFPDGNTVQLNKKGGRPRKGPQSGVLPTQNPNKLAKKRRKMVDQPPMTSSEETDVSLRKRGRPRTSERPVATVPKLSAGGKKIYGRQRKNGAPNETDHQPTVSQMRLEKIKKNGSPDLAQSKDTTVSESSVEGENVDVSDADDPSYDPTQSKPPSVGSAASDNLDGEESLSKGGSASVHDSDSDTSQDTILDEAPTTKTISTKQKHKRPITESGPGDTPTAYKSLAQRKRGRPKKRDKSSPSSRTCPICNRVCSNRFNLKAHIKNHGDERPHTCPVCGKTFKTAGNCNAHMKIHDEAKPYTCKVCGKEFIRRNVYERHALIVHTDEEPYRCDQCDKMFKCEDYLNLHIKKHHIEGRKHLCYICGFAVFTRSALKVHVANHSGPIEKLWQCNICGKFVGSKQKLQNHELTHNSRENREKYLCPICGKAFVSKYYLNNHVAQHTRNVKLSCSECDSTFMSPAAYRTHMMMHSGETPIHCEKCGKGFRSNSNLKQHMMTHTGERPFVCVCGLAFPRNTKLQSHMKTRKHAERMAQSAGGEVPNIAMDSDATKAPDSDTPATTLSALDLFSCATCELSFHYEKRLKQHLRSEKHAKFEAKIKAANSQSSADNPDSIDADLVARERPATDSVTKVRVKKRKKKESATSGKRPFVCSCGLAFRHEKRLKQHLRSGKHAKLEAKAKGANEQPLDKSDLFDTNLVAKEKPATDSLATDQDDTTLCTTESVTKVRKRTYNTSKERPFVCTCGQAFCHEKRLQKHLVSGKHAKLEAQAAKNNSSDIKIDSTDIVLGESAGLSSTVPAVIITGSTVSTDAVSTEVVNPNLCTTESFTTNLFAADLVVTDAAALDFIVAATPGSTSTTVRSYMIDSVALGPESIAPVGTCAQVVGTNSVSSALADAGLGVITAPLPVDVEGPSSPPGGNSQDQLPTND